MSATWGRFESILVGKIRYLKYQGRAFLGDISGVTMNVSVRVESVEKQKPQYPYRRSNAARYVYRKLVLQFDEASGPHPGVLSVDPAWSALFDWIFQASTLKCVVMS